MLWKSIRRWYAANTDRYTGGLIQAGDFRVIYPDGLKTKWLSYGDCKNLKELHGGEIEWRHD